MDWKDSTPWALTVMAVAALFFGFCMKSCAETGKSYRDCIEHGNKPDLCAGAGVGTRPQ
jgi:uncharacterized protein YgiB involved in biofilm formation